MHDVEFSIPSRELGRADISFSIKKNGQKLGRFKVSKGGAVWVPKDQTYGYKVSWRSLEEFMQQNGRHEKNNKKVQ